MVPKPDRKPGTDYSPSGGPLDFINGNQERGGKGNHYSPNEIPKDGGKRRMGYVKRPGTDGGIHLLTMFPFVIPRFRRGKTRGQPDGETN